MDRARAIRGKLFRDSRRDRDARRQPVRNGDETRDYYYYDDENYDDDDDDEEQGSLDDNDTRLGRAKRTRSENNSKLALPGGSAIVSASCDENGHTIKGTLHPEMTFYIRSYLDVLFGAVASEKLRLSREGIQNSEHAIPAIVGCILRYNNIMFCEIVMSISELPLHEPIWYDIDMINNRLRLFLCRSMYDTYCTESSDSPVIMASGIIPIESYNPISRNKFIDEIDMASIHCALVCDHAAQHIISDIYIKDKPKGADIHYRYNEIGTTMHSMFEIQRHGTQCQRSETSNFFTLLKSGREIGSSGAGRAIDELLGNLGGAGSSVDCDPSGDHMVGDFAYSK